MPEAETYAATAIIAESRANVATVIEAFDTATVVQSDRVTHDWLSLSRRVAESDGDVNSQSF